MLSIQVSSLLHRRFTANDQRAARCGGHTGRKWGGYRLEAQWEATDEVGSVGPRWELVSLSQPVRGAPSSVLRHLREKHPGKVISLRKMLYQSGGGEEKCFLVTCPPLHSIIAIHALDGTDINWRNLERTKRIASTKSPEEQQRGIYPPERWNHSRQEGALLSSLRQQMHSKIARALLNPKAAPNSGEGQKLKRSRIDDQTSQRVMRYDQLPPLPLRQHTILVRFDASLGLSIDFGVRVGVLPLQRAFNNAFAVISDADSGT